VPSANIQFSTDPNPPHKGSDIFHVNLKDAAGAAVAGAEVSVTFSMPAMPAMGMAGVRIASTLSDKGGGVYEGSGSLPTGGNWDVTITARRSGQVIGAKQLSITATGGA
jgi:Cu(I)/Ag(I) efflux system membrane fusion protein/cobalt-zinc-cadmium efflux system membrane fusion protein